MEEGSDPGFVLITNPAAPRDCPWCDAGDGKPAGFSLGWGLSMCCNSAGYWEALEQASLLLHTTVWNRYLSLFTMLILFLSQSKCLAQGPVLPDKADAKFRALGGQAAHSRNTLPRVIYLTWGQAGLRPPFLTGNTLRVSGAGGPHRGG